MNLAMPAELALGYKSPSQQARVVTQAWARDNLFCVSCSSRNLTPSPEGSEANDLVCPRCDLRYELKSKSGPIGKKIRDAGFNAMIRAIREDRTPNLVVMHYEKRLWMVRNLFLVPHFAFPESAIEKCAPLSEAHPRHGHVLCNIILEQIPALARIPIVLNGEVSSPARIRQQFENVSPLKGLNAKERGWRLDVLRVVQSLAKMQFTNDDVYAFAPRLQKLHPDNHHIRDKIRQQLQRLRDHGFLRQVEHGVWAVK
jgi:type II restriction enzyme